MRVFFCAALVIAATLSPVFGRTRVSREGRAAAHHAERQKRLERIRVDSAGNIAGTFSTPSTTWPLPSNMTAVGTDCSGIAANFHIATAGFSDDVITAAVMRYEQIFYAFGPNTGAPPTPPANTLSLLTVTVRTPDDRLRFGIDESYTLTVNGSSASIVANTVFGALWGLETMSQLIHRVITTDNNGAINASFYQVCGVNVSDAPRFVYRGEGIRSLALSLSSAATSARALRAPFRLLSALPYALDTCAASPAVRAAFAVNVRSAPRSPLAILIQLSELSPALVHRFSGRAPYRLTARHFSALFASDGHQAGD